MKRNKIKGLTKLAGLTGLVLLTGNLWAGVTIVPPNEKFRLNTADINYRYNFSSKKCEKLDYSYKSITVQWVRQDIANIDEKYENDAGTSYEISYQMSGREYYMVVSDTYGECRMYQDVVINNMKDIDIKKYINMKEK